MFVLFAIHYDFANVIALNFIRVIALDGAQFRMKNAIGNGCRCQRIPAPATHFRSYLLAFLTDRRTYSIRLTFIFSVV